MINIIIASVALFAALKPSDPVKVDREFWGRLIEQRRQIRGQLGGEVDIVLIGDSISHCWDSRCPDVLKDLKRDFKFLNLGISGDTTHNVLWRIEKEGELDGYRAKCIMLLIGTNNSRESAGEIAEGVKCVLEAIRKKQPHATIMLMPILPRREMDCGTAPAVRAKHEQANRIIRTYADGKSVVLFDIGDKFLDGRNDTRWIMSDRLHPDAEGFRLWYREARELLYRFTGKVPPPVTAGWENSAPGRREAAVADEKLVWRADTRFLQCFRLLKLNGAEGKLEIKGDEIRIHKSNAPGELVVEAAPFPLHSHETVMFSVEVNVEHATPHRSHGCIMVSSGSGVFGVQPQVRPLDSGNGRHIMYGLNLQPPGTYYRKYCHYAGEGADVQPMIVVSGDPSISTWRNWRAEDVKDSRNAYRALVEESGARRRAAGFEIASAEEVERQCAESIDHTARMVTENGVTYLAVDGRKVPPAAFHAVYHHSDHSEMTSGRPITSRGVPITIAWVYGANPHYMGNSTWPTGFEYDAKKAADNFRDMMRGDTNALYMVCYDCNAPKDFVAKCCPDEGWLDENGGNVIGGAGYFLNGKGGDYDRERYWPWVSMASPVWREAVKRNLRAFVEELKRTGHSKKLVGIHFLGYNDGQFGMGRPDYSPCAQAEYRRYIKANPHVSTNYWQFCRQLGTIAQADFARAFKEAMGKDVVAIRWDDAPFVVDYSHGTMNRDPDGIDITVSQPTYADRYPALADAPYVPWSSLALHNKMHWYELDLRTWWAMAGSSLPGTTGCGYSPDIVHWRSVYRKLAGEMLATRSGFWFYDMGRGWFAAPEIAEDIGDSLKIADYLAQKKPSPWRSDVAVVVDEEGQFGVEGGRGFSWSGTLYNMCQRQLSYMAGAGVPYDFYLAEDVIADPALLKDKKMVVFIFWRNFDGRRTAAVKALAGRGQTHVFLSESGCLGGAKEATGFDIEYFNRGVRPYALKPERGFKDCVVGSYETEMRRGWQPLPGAKEPFIEPRGRQVWIKEAPGVVVHARYRWDTNKVAIAERRDREARRWYLAVPGGLTPEIFNRLSRESGAYVPVDETGLVVNMNGDFICIHALRGGRFEFRLPFDCRVKNVASGGYENISGGVLPLNVTAGETCWFLLENKD